MSGEGDGVPPALPPAGWYRDPTGASAQRWWDGTAWTMHTGAPSIPPAERVPWADPGTASDAISIGYAWWFLRRRGQTLGMMATGIRAVDRASAGALTPVQVWRRIIAFFLLFTVWFDVGNVIDVGQLGRQGVSPAALVLQLIGGALLFTTALWPLGSSLNQTLQDKIADTIVIRTGTGPRR